jgi:hypothetical protein
MAPEPLVWGIAYPLFELTVTSGEDPSHVIDLICSARNPQFFDLDPEPTVVAGPQTTCHPYADADPARQDSSDRWGKRSAPEERYRDAAFVVLVADNAYSPAGAQVISYTMGRLQILQRARFPTGAARSARPDRETASWRSGSG